LKQRKSPSAFPVPPNVDRNFQAWELLKCPKAVFVPGEGRQRFLCLIDLEEVERNTFHVSDKLAFTNWDLSHNSRRGFFG